MEGNFDYSVHVEKLKKICRICGRHLILGKSTKEHTYNKLIFKNDFQTLYGIDVETEHESIYPPFVCADDGRKLYHLRKGDKNSILKKELHQFTFHTKDCEICTRDLQRLGRPSKKKKLSNLSINKTHSPDHADEKDGMNDLSKFESIQSDHVDQKEKPSTSFCRKKESEKLPDSLIVTQLLENIKIALPSLKHNEKILFFQNMLGLLDFSDLSQFAHCFGKVLSSHIAEDARSLYSVPNSVAELQNFDLMKWLKERSEHVSIVSFLLGIANMENETECLQKSKDKLISMSHAVEQIYKVRYPTLILPIAFLLNICTYAITGSKTVVNMIGNYCPSGHYKTVTQWLKDQGTTEPQIPVGDLMNVFDNEQVISRKHAIKPNNKGTCSIITNKGIVELQSKERIQCKAEMKPVVIQKIRSGNDELTPNQLKMKLAAESIINGSSEQLDMMEKLHYEQLYHAVQGAIDNVKQDQCNVDGKMVDPIDLQLAQETVDDTTIKCTTCGTLNRKRKIVCEGCNEKDGLKKAKEQKKNEKEEDIPVKPTKTSFVKYAVDEMDHTSTINFEQTNRYEHISSGHRGKHKILLTDPVFCNPNSSETVARVLRKIGKDNKIKRYGGDERSWTFVCCDGLPYMICRKLQEETVICTVDKCNKTFMSKVQLQQHAKEFHPATDEIQYANEFDWFYLRIGSGHYEMNLIKSFFELNWSPFMEALCEKMGFTSESAKQYAKGCKDHHKSWHLMMVFHAASLRELVTPFVRDSLQLGQNPTAKLFFKAANEMYQSRSNPNFNYLMDQTCRFAQGIVNFRMAIRRNNAQLLASAKHMTKELFHGRHHPKYQAIELYDTLQNILMPSDVLELSNSYTSITTSGNESAGQDFDFILEEKNRQLKSWIPKGVPSDQIWQEVCRNNEPLELLKVNSFALFDIHTDVPTPRTPDLELAIKAFRCILRKTGYTMKKKDHVSVTGHALDEELVNFVETASKRRLLYLKAEFLGEEIEDKTFRHPVPITIAERENFMSIDKMTVSEIKEEILELIELIPDPLQKDYHLQLAQKELKGKKKAVHVRFLEELREFILHQENPNLLEENVEIQTCER